MDDVEQTLQARDVRAISAAVATVTAEIAMSVSSLGLTGLETYANSQIRHQTLRGDCWLPASVRKMRESASRTYDYAYSHTNTHPNTYTTPT
jgi:hypothetical protein